ncbi:glycosyltransferase [Micromonospora inyonensis]|uniref:glycosyltransferase n=1 Tax=Micromonospora inyonensis TaxID=47866 RepID=UPI00159EFB0A|nr:glycosyltransferase [Micromonospora inyonensis]
MTAARLPVGASVPGPRLSCPVCSAAPHTLTALADQRMPRSRFEVVVADDGSTDDTRETVEAFTERLSLR